MPRRLVLLVALSVECSANNSERLLDCGNTPYLSKRARGSCPTPDLLTGENDDTFLPPTRFDRESAVQERCDELHCGYYIWNLLTGHAQFCRLNYFESSATSTDDSSSSSYDYRVGRKETWWDVHRSPDIPPHTATTTRYWDCSGGSCGCAYLPHHLVGDVTQPAHCHANALFRAPPNNPHGATFYGTAAVSGAVGAVEGWLPAVCGTCWKLTGTSNIVGLSSVNNNKTTTIVVKAANICPNGNDLCARGPHFDIAAPGFDVREYSLCHHCPELEPDEKEGGGFHCCEGWMRDSLDPTENCDCDTFVDPILREGCQNFLSLGWDNPAVHYERVPECPAELATLSCWHENGEQYPWPVVPAKCSDPAGRVRRVHPGQTQDRGVCLYNAAVYINQPGRGTCPRADLLALGSSFQRESQVQEICTDLSCEYYVWDASEGRAWFCAKDDNYESVDNGDDFPMWRVGRIENWRDTARSNKLATTTRYWDCMGGSCGCAYLPQHLQGDPNKSAMCHSNALFQAPPDNPWKASYYGTAAVSRRLIGDAGWLPEGCGKCWKLTGRSNIPGFFQRQRTIVVKASNICPDENLLCARGPHFDIAAPGFDARETSIEHNCDWLEPDEHAGFLACEGWMIESIDPTENCNCSKFQSPTLRAGCENFLELQWSNVVVSYEQVDCPTELSSLPCWEENGNRYPPWPTVPPKCADPFALGFKQ